MALLTAQLSDVLRPRAPTAGLPATGLCQTTLGRVPSDFGDRGDWGPGAFCPLQLLQLAFILSLSSTGSLQCFPGIFVKFNRRKEE